MVATASLYPNPALTRTSLDLSQLLVTASYQVQLLGATGSRVQAWQVTGGWAQPLDLSPLTPGLCTVLVTGPQTDAQFSARCCT